MAVHLDHALARQHFPVVLAVLRLPGKAMVAVQVRPVQMVLVKMVAMVPPSLAVMAAVVPTIAHRPPVWPQAELPAEPVVLAPLVLQAVLVEQFQVALLAQVLMVAAAVVALARLAELQVMVAMAAQIQPSMEVMVAAAAVAAAVQALLLAMVATAVSMAQAAVALVRLV